MNKEFISFLLELKNKHCYEIIEFRLLFQKKYLKYRENFCPSLEKELKELIKQYEKIST